jgi:hypothetical protein
VCAECPCSWASLLRKFIATVSAMEFSYFHLGVGGDCTMAAFGFEAVPNFVFIDFARRY